MRWLVVKAISGKQYTRLSVHFKISPLVEMTKKNGRFFYENRLKLTTILEMGFYYKKNCFSKQAQK